MARPIPAASEIRGELNGGDRRSASASGEEARAFLQTRLAFLGKAYALLGILFFAIGHLVSAWMPQYSWGRAAPQLVLLANAIYLVQWLACRRGRWPEPTLKLCDGISATLVAACNAGMVFSGLPGELPGLAHGRMLELVTFGLVFRAIAVPSSARRTFALGLLASAFPVATTHFWYATQPQTAMPAAVMTIGTALWCLGAVAISTLASRVIFGLRREVHEARQLGQYTLHEKIGEGGMGEVYRASHAMLRRPTAVKLLLPDRAGHEQLERFEREVQITSRLTHPNTVSIFDYGRTPDGVFYYAMEYLEGLDLEHLVRVGGPQTPARVAHILRQVAGSLAEAHAIGLIHRDVKPANVILVPERGGAVDVAKVLDFGLAKELDRRATLTQDDWMIGTPHYLAPETISGGRGVDGRTDLYALGCVGYYLLTGRTVFEGQNVIEVASHHLNARPLPPAERLGQEVPEPLSDLILACLEKDRERRPVSALAFIATLDACRVPAWTEAEARVWWAAVGDRERRLALEPAVAHAPPARRSIMRCAPARRREHAPGMKLPIAEPRG